MNFFKHLALLTLILSAQFAHSDSCDPCDPCASTAECNLCDFNPCDVKFSVYGDFLYWEVCVGDLIFEDDDSITTYQNPGHDSGFRIGAVASWNNWDLGLRYTSLDVNHDKDFDDEGSAKFKFDSDIFDIELAYRCCLGCEGFSLTPFVGTKLAWIDQSYDKTDDGDDKYTLDFSGFGLYTGFSTRWELCNFNGCGKHIPVALVTRASTGILRSTLKGTEGDEDPEVKKELDFIIPVHEAFVGFDFTFCNQSCFDANLQLGYEIQYWGWHEDSSTSDITHLGMNGLVVRLGASF